MSGIYSSDYIARTRVLTAQGNQRAREVALSAAVQAFAGLPVEEGWSNINRRGNEITALAEKFRAWIQEV